MTIRLILWFVLVVALAVGSGARVLAARQHDEGSAAQHDDVLRMAPSDDEAPDRVKEAL